jgi:hypothetical protein
MFHYNGQIRPMRVLSEKLWGLSSRSRGILQTRIIVGIQKPTSVFPESIISAAFLREEVLGEHITPEVLHLIREQNARTIAEITKVV